MNLLFKKSKPVPQGKLIVIDGIPGSGRTTQINLLAESLTFAGFSVATADFPQTNSLSSALINKYSDQDLTTYGTATLLAINHLEAKDKLINWISKGTIVLATNYVITNAAVGGSEMDLHSEQIKFFRWINSLEYEMLGIPKSNLNLILHTPAKYAQELLANNIRTNKNRMDLVELIKLEQSYLNVADVFPQTKLIHCVKGSKLAAPNEIHNTIWEIVRRIVLKNYLPNK